MNPTYELWVKPADGSGDWRFSGTAGSLRECVDGMDRFTKVSAWFKRIEAPCPAPAPVALAAPTPQLFPS
jgi:hypothetical protein